jgi:hypothetical protein
MADQPPLGDLLRAWADAEEEHADTAERLTMSVAPGMMLDPMFASVRAHRAKAAFLRAWAVDFDPEPPAPAPPAIPSLQDQGTPADIMGVELRDGWLAIRARLAPHGDTVLLRPAMRLPGTVTSWQALGWWEVAPNAERETVELRTTVVNVPNRTPVDIVVEVAGPDGGEQLAARRWTTP